MRLLGLDSNCAYVYQPVTRHRFPLIVVSLPSSTMPPLMNHPDASPRRSPRGSTLHTDSVHADAQTLNSPTGRKKRKNPPTNRRDRGPSSKRATLCAEAILQEPPLFAQDRAHGVSFPFSASPPHLNRESHGPGLQEEETSITQLSAHHPHTEGESTYTYALLDLITGKTPAVKPKPSGAGLEYVPLLRHPYDRNSPDLIRVLIVHPGGSEDHLECSIEIRLLPLLDARGKAKKTVVPGIADGDIGKYMTDYVALSYAWEGQKPTVSIDIRHPSGGLSLLVTKNLKIALKALRHTSENRHFWADAICMDQDNNEEKSQQLPLMSRIYNEAMKVCVWLGEQDKETAKAFGLMDKIRNWKRFNVVVEEDIQCAEWLAFIGLLKRPWFRRRWVVQEIVLAGQAEIRCGSQWSEWMEFAQAVAFFEAMEDRVKKKFRQAVDQEQHPDMFGHIREYGANRLVKVTANIVTRRDDGHVLQRTESLENLISTLTPFETGERRDIIYSILSLAKDVRATSANTTLRAELVREDMPEHLRDRDDWEKNLGVLKSLRRKFKIDQFPVNYAKKFDVVCDDLYNFTTLQSTNARSLDLICRPWCPDGDPTTNEGSAPLPSWVRSLSDRAYQLDEDDHVVRVNADTLVGLPDKTPYQASGTLRGAWSFERDPKPLSDYELDPGGVQILSVLGFQLDTIRKIEDKALGGTLPKSWLAYKRPERTTSVDNNSLSYHHKKGSGSSDFERNVSTEFWKTMVAGKGPNGQNPPMSYSLVCQELFETTTDILLQSKRDRTTNVILKEFIDRVLSVIWGRRLAKTAFHDRLALLPGAAEMGDVICILYGCSVPVVLRKTGEQTTTGEDLWQLIGECYMYEMMAGDALIQRRLAHEEEMTKQKEEGLVPGSFDFFHKDRRMFKIR